MRIPRYHATIVLADLEIIFEKFEKIAALDLDLDASSFYFHLVLSRSGNVNLSNHDHHLPGDRSMTSADVVTLLENSLHHSLLSSNRD